MQATLMERPIALWAKDLVDAAEAGLRRMGSLDREGRDETIHLAKLRALVDAGMSPADAMLAEIDLERDLKPQILEKAHV
jgi:glutamate--cysteine ligase